MKMKTYLTSKIAVATLVVGCLAGSSVRADDAATLWNSKCASCHGKDGKGNTMMGRKKGIKDLTDATVQASFTDADATKAIKEGITVNGEEKMKGFGDKLSDADVAALVAQVRTYKGK